MLALLHSPLLCFAQSVPANAGSTTPSVGFSLPTIGGSLNYAVSASELVSTGFYNSGASFTTELSGDLGYVSKSQRHPFSAVYSGGVLIAESDQPTTTFQTLSFSQVLSTRKWNLSVTDSISLLPQSPVTGLSGIPGSGDLGVEPVAVGSNSGIGILTDYGPRVSNAVTGTATRQLTGRMSLQASGLYTIQRFFGDNSQFAFDSTTESGLGGLNYQVTARDSISGNYNYSKFEYAGSISSFTAQGASFGYNRQWSPHLTTNVYAGPQIITGDGGAYDGADVTVAAGASATYQNRLTTYDLVYARGAANGSGVIPGSFSDNITLAAHRQFGRDWAIAGNVAYSRTSSLPNDTQVQFKGDSVAFGGQGSRRLGENFSAFASYTLQHQNYSGTGFFSAQNAFGGIYQVFGIGITYSPRSILFGR